MSFYERQDRRLPVRPDINQLRHQAKELLRNARDGKSDALAVFTNAHPESPSPNAMKLADAQLALARLYGASTWARLVQACELVDAIWRDDVAAVRSLIAAHPRLLHEDALVKPGNWGPPMSYAANLGRTEIIKALVDFGAADFQHALGRAVLQSQIDTAELLHRYMGSPPPPEGALAGPAYTLSVTGTAFAFRVGAKVVDAHGRRVAPVDLPLETDARDPAAKHAILEMYAANGVELPDTPTMALHRGRLDLLKQHLWRDPALLSRRFTHEEIYPPEMGCHDEVNATQGTPLKGTTLLHLCVDYDEVDIAKWLIDKGADVNARADVDIDGFGAHTPLFCTVVSQPNFWMNFQGRTPDAPLTRLLLDRGANPKLRASLRKKLHPGYGPKYDVEHTYEYRSVTALGWGAQFHAKPFVSEEAMRLIRERGGTE